MRRVALVVVVAACGGGGGSGTGDGVVAQFAIPGEPTATGHDFYSLPFPNDLRRDADGTIALADFPTGGSLVDKYRMAAEDLDGFALNAGMFARFSAPIDPASLPDPAGSVEATASVYLVNVDPASPEHGQRTPIVAHFRAEPTPTIGANQLIARPYPGFPLREHTTYALVITNRVTDPDGDAIVRDTPFETVMATGASSDITGIGARAAYAPLLGYLDEAGGDERADVVSAAVFTTQTITATVKGLRVAVEAGPAPVSTDAQSKQVRTSYEELIGTYVAPNFQSGAVPYDDPGSGRIALDATGAAIVQRMEPMRFALTVPLGDTPVGGWPIVIYQHGTGGDYESFIADGTANALAGSGLAVISTDQVLHGPRNPNGDPELDFFKFINPYAMRDNALQGAADAFVQRRLAAGLSITTATRTITLNTTHIGFFGHSQGGLTGPPFVAFEPTCNAAVLSGTGGLLYLALLEKRQPLDIPTLLAGYLGDDPIDADNPSLALLQLWVERADGANYAPFMVRSPAPGLAPRNIFQTEGFTDSYTPNDSIEAFATALGGDIVALPDMKPIEGVTLRGRGIVPAPITANVNGVTAVLAQFTMAAGSDGHFVVFDSPVAKHLAAEFLGTAARTGTATVVAP